MSCAAFKLRFGVIGTNFISDWLLEGAAEDSRFEVAAIYSRSQDTANAFAEKHNIPHTFISLEKMASSPLIDAVYIASPTALHSEQAILFMEHGNLPVKAGHLFRRVLQSPGLGFIVVKFCIRGKYH